MVTAVYGPNHTENRGAFWDELREIRGWKDSTGHRGISILFISPKKGKEATATRDR